MDNSDIEYDLETDSYRANQLIGGRGLLSHQVVKMVATITEADISELEPLNGAIDPDALDRLFAPRPGGRSRPGGEVRFTYHGFDIVVRGDGEIVARPA